MIRYAPVVPVPDGIGQYGAMHLVHIFSYAGDLFVKKYSWFTNINPAD
jgi:hypothetical protein